MQWQVPSTGADRLCSSYYSPILHCIKHANRNYISAMLTCICIQQFVPVTWRNCVLLPYKIRWIYEIIGEHICQLSSWKVQVRSRDQSLLVPARYLREISANYQILYENTSEITGTHILWRSTRRHLKKCKKFDTIRRFLLINGLKWKDSAPIYKKNGKS